MKKRIKRIWEKNRTASSPVSVGKSTSWGAISFAFFFLWLTLRGTEAFLFSPTTGSIESSGAKTAGEASLIESDFSGRGVLSLFTASLEFGGIVGVDSFFTEPILCNPGDSTHSSHSLLHPCISHTISDHESSKLILSWIKRLCPLFNIAEACLVQARVFFPGLYLETLCFTPIKTGQEKMGRYICMNIRRPYTSLAKW